MNAHLILTLLPLLGGFDAGVPSRHVAVSQPLPWNWQHKDWRVMVDAIDDGGLECLAFTGGDGDDSFWLRARRGGRIRIEYAEATVRGYPTRLTRGDRIVLVVSGRDRTAVQPLDVAVGVGADGIPFANAVVPDAALPGLLAQMRAGVALTVQRVRSADDAPETLAGFSLLGFTANSLKVAEWCDFMPDLSDIRS